MNPKTPPEMLDSGSGYQNRDDYWIPRFEGPFEYEHHVVRAACHETKAAPPSEWQELARFAPLVLFVIIMTILALVSR